METLEALTTRRSVRAFSTRQVPEEVIRKILAAGMSGPSCVNARDWSFVVVRERSKLEAMAEANGPYATPLKTAAFGILVCGDLGRAFKGAKDYWVVDGAIAAQNMVLAARDLGVGSVWLGTWPQMERVEAQSELFALPGDIVPHSVLAFGYPLDERVFAQRDLYEEDRVHFEQW